MLRADSDVDRIDAAVNAAGEAIRMFFHKDGKDFDRVITAFLIFKIVHQTECHLEMFEEDPEAPGPAELRECMTDADWLDLRDRMFEDMCSLADGVFEEMLMNYCKVKSIDLE